MSDDESTRPIDIDALRAAVAAKRASMPDPAEVAPALVPLEEQLDEAEDLFPSDEYTNVDRPEQEPPASVTGVDLPIAQPVAEDSYVAPSPSWTGGAPDIQSMTLQIPRGTKPADLAKALAAAKLKDTDEQPAVEELETQTRLPLDELPLAAEEDEGAGLVTYPAHPADLPDDTKMGLRDRDQVRAAFAAAASSEETAVYNGPIPALASPPPPAFPGVAIPDFVVPAPSSSSNILEIDSADLESVPEIEDLAKTGESPPLALPPERPEAEAIDELPRFSLAGDDEEDVPESGGATRVLRPSRPDIVIASQPDGEVTSISTEAEMLADSAEVQSMPSSPSMQVSTESITRVGQTAQKPSVQSTSVRPPVTASVRPPPPPYQPPAPVGRPLGPAYAIDPDRDERQLQDEGRYEALVDLYRLRLADADGPSSRCALMVKIASVYEDRLARLDDAFDLLVTAWEQRPMDEDVTASLDRVGKRLQRIGELCERATRNLHTADPETRVALLGHIVYWYERCLGRGAEIGRFVSELERLDKTHPVILRRHAQNAAASGDFKAQRDLLVRALDRTTRRDEKVLLNVALAGSHAGTPEAVRYFEAAVAIDPTSLMALQGLERIGRDQEKHAQVEWALEQQIELAPTVSERVDALLKLADVQETKFLRRERAAELLERVLELEPTNPSALKALERCYHALRDWPKLARILRMRAENTYDKKAQVELLQTAAEVYESKLGEPAQAVDALRDLLLAEPTHKRALTDLARLSEKQGDWTNVATYKAKLAELAPTKREASKAFVQLGDFLAQPDRDPLAARLQYERAVQTDAANAGAWEALQKAAAAAGDDRRVMQCLFERSKHEASPRQRATVLVELARVHEGRGETRQAREAFEAAVKADGTNEAAASYMLDAYTHEEKWAEAAPLCELLVNVAVRDKDRRALFTRLRLQTRIAAALGDAEKAMTAALAALDAGPEDVDAQADLIAVSSQVRAKPQVVARAKDWLARLASVPLPVEALIRLAQLQRDLQDVDTAAQTLERALAAEPDHPDAIKELADVYLAQGDFPRACKLLVDMARNATSADARFKLLVDAGEIWARRAQELEKAATVFEEARQIKPLDHWLLHTLMWLYGELGDWSRLSHVLAGISQIQESPERKAKSLFALAQVVRDKLHDVPRASDLFDHVLDVDKKRLDVFEELVRMLTEAKDWNRLELSYRKMIARIKDDPEQKKLQFALFQQLGLIYRDRLGDAEHAFEALDAASRIRPDDTVVRKIVTELLVVTDNLDDAVKRTRDLIARDPHKASLYAQLYDLFLRQHFFDKAWCAVNVLARLTELTPEQRQFHEDYPPMPVAKVPGQLVEQAWRSHVLHPDLDPTLTAIFALMTPAVARMRFAQLRPEQRVGRPFTPNHSRLHDPIRQAFANSAEILAMRPPDLLLGDPSSPFPFAPAFAPFGAIFVATPAVEARADSLAYVIAKRLAEQRPELCARAFFPSMPDLTALLGAAVRVCRQERAMDAAAAALDASLAPMMSPEELHGIRSIVMQKAMEGGLVDVKGWLRSADLSSMRAALLVCADVEPVRKGIVDEPQTAADLSPREKVGELYKFAVSDLYSDLRGAIGIAVQG